MNQKLYDLLWGSGDEREILLDARKEFKKSAVRDPAAAHVAMVSVYITLAGRYTTGLLKLRGLKHYLNALDEVRCAGWDAGNLADLNSEQIDIVTSALAQKFPWPVDFILGGRSRREHALDLVRHALDRDRHKYPHTPALLWCTKAKLLAWESNAIDARTAIENAETWIPRITDEKQLLRVLKKVGFFYIDHCHDAPYWRGMDMVKSARGLAQATSKDQFEKINAELRKRGAVIE